MGVTTMMLSSNGSTNGVLGRWVAITAGNIRRTIAFELTVMSARTLPDQVQEKFPFQVWEITAGVVAVPI